MQLKSSATTPAFKQHGILVYLQHGKGTRFHPPISRDAAIEKAVAKHAGPERQPPLPLSMSQSPYAALIKRMKLRSKTMRITKRSVQTSQELKETPSCNLEIIDKQTGIQFHLIGESTKAENKCFGEVGMELMNEMWRAVKEAKIKEYGDQPSFHLAERIVCRR
jgi:hypothetical protein